MELENKYGKLWRSSEIREFFGISEGCFHKWRTGGVLNMIKIGRSWFVRDSEVQRLLVEGSEPPEVTQI